jgi:hypothetical protein
MILIAWLDTLNLLVVFNYYLIVGFIASMAANVRRYRAILGLLWGFPSRWPKLLELVRKHRTIFFGWPTLPAIGLAFLLMLSNSLAIRLIWTQARVTFEQLWGLWLPLGAVLLAGRRRHGVALGGRGRRPGGGPPSRLIPERSGVSMLATAIDHNRAFGGDGDENPVPFRQQLAVPVKRQRISSTFLRASLVRSRANLRVTRSPATSAPLAMARVCTNRPPARSPASAERILQLDRGTALRRSSSDGGDSPRP